MSKPDIRAGQEWEKRDTYAGTESVTRIRVLEVGTNRHEVATVAEDGRLVRKRSLISSAFSNTPSGYCLVKDAPPETKACDNRCGPDIHSAACDVAPPSAPSSLPAGGVLIAHTSTDGKEWERAPALDVAAPSPLEAVRKWAHDGLTTAGGPLWETHTVREVLATLEESIRADATRFYRDREEFFSRFFKVADAGQYRADWEAATKRWETDLRADERNRVGEELRRRGYPAAGYTVLAMK